VKELGAIALSTFKLGGEIVLPPFLALNLRKKTFLLKYGSIYCSFSQGYALKP
jgi:hypothetical protein